MSLHQFGEDLDRIIASRHRASFKETAAFIWAIILVIICASWYVGKDVCQEKLADFQNRHYDAWRNMCRATRVVWALAFYAINLVVCIGIAWLFHHELSAALELNEDWQVGLGCVLACVYLPVLSINMISWQERWYGWQLKIAMLVIGFLLYLI